MAEQIVVTGMVLASIPVGDYDRRVTILTKERGKISAFARGARRMNSPLMGVTNPFCFGRYKIYEGRTSNSIDSVEIDQYFQEITTDLDVVYYGFYFLELADYYTYENMDARNELNLLYAAFKALKKPEIPHDLVRYIVELKMMVFHGSYPQMFHCGGCGTEEHLEYFGAARGEVFCKDCGKSILDAVSMKQSTLYALQFIITANVGKLFSFTVTPDVLNELRVIMERLALLSIDRKLKSLEMLNLMTRL